MKKQHRLFTTAMICIVMFFGVSCNKDDEDQNSGFDNQTVPTVKTNEVTEITSTTAICGGEVTSENGWRVTERGVCWGTESNPTLSDSHTIDGESIGKFTLEITGLIPNTKYYVRAYAINAAGIGFGSEMSFNTQCVGGDINNYDYVDLGLPSGTLWATCNVGAENPWDYGDYFQWGSTTAVTSTSINVGWSTCPYSISSNVFTKYVPTHQLEYWSGTGVPDGLSTLEFVDDAARANWGSDWRMPTEEEWCELYENTTNEWTTLNGVNGQLFTSKVAGYTDAALFLPASGYRIEFSLNYEGSQGSCWLSSLYSDNPSMAYQMSFHLYGVGQQSRSSRCIGLTVRPVR